MTIRIGAEPEAAVGTGAGAGDGAAAGCGGGAALIGAIVGIRIAGWDGGAAAGTGAGATTGGATAAGAGGTTGDGDEIAGWLAVLPALGDTLAPPGANAGMRIEPIGARAGAGVGAGPTAVGAGAIAAGGGAIAGGGGT